MADVELDSEIVAKLQSAFKVSQKEIFTLLDFFNTQLKPAIKVHYLSHLVSSIEEMINEKEKSGFLAYIKETERTEKDVNTLTNLINEKRIIFSGDVKVISDNGDKLFTKELIIKL